MEIKDLKTIIKMITETDITEFELETAGEKIRIQRGRAAETVGHTLQPAIAVPPAQMPQVVSPPQASSVPPPPASAESERLQTVISPIVGTMYRAPAPDAPPYVEVGQVVEKGQVLCIVEAMKLMNEIEAEFRCRIVKICKENAQPVEYGEPLFLVEPL